MKNRKKDIEVKERYWKTRVLCSFCSYFAGERFSVFIVQRCFTEISGI